jgi:hypothetical protein
MTQGEGDNPTPEVNERVRQAALALLRADSELDDSVFTPPGVMGAAVEIDAYTQATALEGAMAVEPEYGRRKTYKDLTPDEKRAVRKGALEMIAFDQESNELLDRLGGAGWVFAGGGKWGERVMDVAFALPEQIAHMEETAFLHLPIRDEEGALLPGFELGIGEDDGIPGMSYIGPIDDKFREVVDAMVKVAQPPEAT